MDELEETFGLLSMTDEPDTPAEARTDLRSSRNSHRVAPEPVQLPQASPETSSQEADNLLAKVYPNREQRNAVRRNLLPKLVQEAFEKQNELEKISWEDFMQNLLDTNGIDYKKNTAEKTKDKTKEKETGGHDKAGDAGDEEAPERKNRARRNVLRKEGASRILSSKSVHKMEMMRIVHCPQVPFEVDSADTIGRRLLGKRIADWMFFPDRGLAFSRSGRAAVWVVSNHGDFRPGRSRGSVLGSYICLFDGRVVSLRIFNLQPCSPSRSGL